MGRTFEFIYEDFCNNRFKGYKGYIKDISGIINVCLKKLVKDGFIHKNKEQKHINLNTNEETFKTAYSITFEGYLFLETQTSYKNFYANQHAENIRLANVEKHQKAYEYRMFYLTAILAFSGFVASFYYLSEMWNSHKVIKAIEISTFLFVFLFGLIAGIIIYKLISNQIEKKE